MKTLHYRTWRASELVSTSRGCEEGGAPEEGMEAPGKPLPPDFLALGILLTGLFPGGLPRGWDSAIPLQGVRVPSLVRELRSGVPAARLNKKKKKRHLESPE